MPIRRATPDDLTSRRALSSSVSALSHSVEGSKARDLIIDWIVNELGKWLSRLCLFDWFLSRTSGASLSRNSEEIKPCVYPDKYSDMRPVLPEVEDISKINKKTLCTWIRDFLNALWRMFLVPSTLSVINSLMGRMARWPGGLVMVTPLSRRPVLFH